MTTANCNSCQGTFAQADLVMSAQGTICPGCKVDQQLETSSSPLKSPLAATAAAAVLLPHAINIQTSSGDAFLNYTALAGGGLGLLLAVAMGVRLVRDGHFKEAALAGVFLLMALNHLVLRSGILTQLV